LIVWTGFRINRNPHVARHVAKQQSRCCLLHFKKLLPQQASFGEVGMLLVCYWRRVGLLFAPSILTSLLIAKLSATSSLLDLRGGLLQLCKMSPYYKVFEEDGKKSSTASTLSSKFGSMLSVDWFISNESLAEGPIPKHCYSSKHRVFRASAQNFLF
jgi:hypothetical protein